MAHDDGDGLIIDCDTCAVRGAACHDCVVTVFLDLPGRATEGAHSEGFVALDPAEARALDALAAGGLLPPLRLTPQAETG